MRISVPHSRDELFTLEPKSGGGLLNPRSLHKELTCMNAAVSLSQQAFACEFMAWDLWVRTSKPEFFKPKLQPPGVHRNPEANAAAEGGLRAFVGLPYFRDSSCPEASNSSPEATLFCFQVELIKIRPSAST